MSHTGAPPAPGCSLEMNLPPERSGALVSLAGGETPAKAFAPRDPSSATGVRFLAGLLTAEGSPFFSWLVRF